jgi:hypothetical protein
MGEVYEAEDRELRERVALKTIRPAIGTDERAVERFKREIQLARKVTHPNVCRIFDLGYHTRPDSPPGDGGTLFLTMEFVHGETLAERLRRTGPMAVEEARPIVLQMLAGLGEAHEAGVVHRDFKSSNVILVPSQEPAGKVRAVITDFGLACLSAGQGVSVARISSTGEIVGTPSYMAPEQVRGGEVTTKTDIYALGLVVYEMVTGTLPFLSDSPISTAVRRLEEPPPEPRKYAPGLDKRWEELILSCLALNPEDRLPAGVLSYGFAGIDQFRKQLPAEGREYSRALRMGERRKLLGALGMSKPRALLLSFMGSLGNVRWKLTLKVAVTLTFLLAAYPAYRTVRERYSTRAVPETYLQAAKGIPSQPAAVPAAPVPPPSAGLVCYVISVKGDVVVVDLGSVHGLKPGVRLGVYKAYDPGKAVGTLEVTKVRADSSEARIVAMEPGIRPEFSDIVRLQVQPAPPSGVIKIMTTPEGLEVLIDGGFVGISPVSATLPPGTHAFTLRLAGKELYTGRFELKPDDILSKTVNLTTKID